MQNIYIPNHIKLLSWEHNNSKPDREKLTIFGKHNTAKQQLFQTNNIPNDPQLNVPGQDTSEVLCVFNNLMTHLVLQFATPCHILLWSSLMCEPRNPHWKLFSVTDFHTLFSQTYSQAYGPKNQPRTKGEMQTTGTETTMILQPIT